MKATEIRQESQEKTERTTDRIGIFFETFHIGTFLNRSGICKVRGTSSHFHGNDIPTDHR